MLIGIPSRAVFSLKVNSVKQPSKKWRFTYPSWGRQPVRHQLRLRSAEAHRGSTTGSSSQKYSRKNIYHRRGACVAGVAPQPLPSHRPAHRTLLTIFVSTVLPAPRFLQCYTVRLESKLYFIKYTLNQEIYETMWIVGEERVLYEIMKNVRNAELAIIL